MSKQSWFNIKNSASEGQPAEILIYGEIGSYDISAAYFISQLKACAGAPLDVRICSVGGSVFDGMAIHSALERYSGSVTVHVDGIAASIASVIAMAGDLVHMPANALMMIHNPSGIEFGEADDMRRYADLLDKVKDTIIACYTARTGLDAKQVGKMMDETTYLSAGEALELGFCDYIDQPIEVTDCLKKLPGGVDTVIDGMSLKELLNKIAGGKAPKNDATQPPADDKKEGTTPPPAPEKKEGEPETKPADDKKEGSEEKPAGTPENKANPDLATSVTNLTRQLEAERLKVTNLTADKTRLEGEIKDATSIANTIIAGMPIDTPLPKGGAETGDGAPADCAAFVKSYQALVNEGKQDEASAFYSKFGPKFGF